LFFFVISVISLFPENRGLFFDVNEHLGIALAKDPRFDVMVQPVTNLATSLSVDLFSMPIYLSLGFETGFVSDSFPVYGTIMRGFNETGIFLGISYRLFDIQLGSINLDSEVTLLSGGSLANYFHTELFFFYPYFLIKPLIELKNPKQPAFSFYTGIPLKYSFRRDLSFNFETSIALGIRIYPFLIGKGEKAR